MSFISLADLARHLKVSRQAVSKGRKTRLAKSSVQNDRGIWGVRDLQEATEEWFQNSTTPREPEDSETVENASATLKKWQAALAELKFREAAKEVVLASEVSSGVAEDYASIRTRLLAIPSRARQALPHITTADIGILEGLVREALEELAQDRNG